MVLYTYLLSLNDPDKLKEYISITLPSINHITHDSSSRNVDITFDGGLTSEQRITLDNLITNFQNDESQPYVNYNNILSNRTKIFNMNWVSVCVWTCSSLSSIYVLSSMIPIDDISIGDPECSYNIRILNLSTNEIVVPSTTLSLLYDGETSLNLDTCLYKNSIVELHVKRNSLCNSVVISSVGYI